MAGNCQSTNGVPSFDIKPAVKVENGDLPPEELELKLKKLALLGSPRKRCNGNHGNGRGQQVSEGGSSSSGSTNHLSPMCSPACTPSTSRPHYLGDDEDHSSRDRLKRAISPSPRADERHRAEGNQAALADMTNSYRDLLMSIGEDVSRPGLLKTPERAAKAMLYFTKGYDEKMAGEFVVP